MGRTAVRTTAATALVLERLGQHLATARIRRGWRQEDVARRAGIHVNTVRKLEAGAPGTGIGAYAAALWAMGLLEHLADVAGPERDREGATLAAARLGTRARTGPQLDDDF